MSLTIVRTLDMSTIMFYSYTFNVASKTYLPYITSALGKGMFSYACTTFNKAKMLKYIGFWHTGLAANTLFHYALP